MTNAANVSRCLIAILLLTLGGAAVMVWHLWWIMAATHAYQSDLAAWSSRVDPSSPVPNFAEYLGDRAHRLYVVVLIVMGSNILISGIAFTLSVQRRPSTSVR